LGNGIDSRIDPDDGGGFGEKLLGDVGQDIDEGTEPKTGFEAPRFFGGSVIGRGGAIDPGPGDGDDSAEYGYSLTFELEVEENICGDLDSAGPEKDSATDWSEFTNSHIIACTNEGLAAALDKGDISKLAGYDKINSPGDYTESIVPMTNFGQPSKSPTDGKTKQVHNVSVVLPPDSTYVSVHSLTCIDLQAVNGKYGTSFSDQYQVLSYSSEVLMSSGQTVSNKMKNYSKLEEFSSIDISFSEVEDLPNPIKEFATSTDSSGDVSFVFDFDQEAALKSMPLGSLLNKPLAQSVKNDILSRLTISSMEVQRNEIKDSILESKYGSAPVLVASSAQPTAHALLETSTREVRVGRNMSGKMLGSIGEINLQGTREIRNFTGNDKAPEGGAYTYTIKILTADVLSAYLREKLIDLQRAISVTTSWLAEVSAPEHSDTLRGTFSYAGSQKLRRKYQSAPNPMHASLATYAHILGDIFCVSSPGKIMNSLAPIIDSTTGSPTGAQKIISSMEDLASKMMQLLGDKISYGQSNMGEVATTAGSGQSGVHVFERTFDNQILDRTDVSNIGTGYSYLGAGAGSTQAGVKTISHNNYVSRTQDELSYFSEKEKISAPTEWSDLEISPAQISSLTDMSKTMSSYLTPSSVDVGKKESFDLSTAAAMWDNDISANASVALNAANSGLTLETDSHLALLGELGITCRTDHDKAVENDSTGTFPVDSSAMSPFATSDAFTATNIDVDDLSTKQYSISTATLAAARALYPALVSAEAGVQCGAKLSLLNIAAPESTIVNNNSAVLADLPLQLKSAISSTSIDTKQDFLSEPLFSSSPKADMSLGAIGQIETLSYARDSNGNLSPQWKLLTPYRLNQAKNISLRCRIVGYTNSEFGIRSFAGTQHGINDAHFVLAGNDLASSRSRPSARIMAMPSATPTNQRSRNGY
jgi:hypothetical protein